MKTYAPGYYNDFKCIASGCRHSCCIGWDVYLDEEAISRYSSLDGCLGKHIRENLTELEDGIGFRMCPDGKCPFLNGDGLCDIIIQKGEGYLGEICSEHPRFYNFFSDHTEAGLGLSCEEAARIILSSEKNDFTIISEDEEEEWELGGSEEYILTKRQEVFDILCNNALHLDSKVDMILTSTHAHFKKKTPTELSELLSRLERLDDDWTKFLEDLALFGNYDPIPELEVAFENLLHYFIYRHTASAESEEDFSARIAFSVFGYTVIKALCNAEIIKNGACSFEALVEFARAYSAEIEYSEENTEALLDFLRAQ